MAKNATNAGHPVDEPSIERQGLMHRESDAPGNAKWLALPPESKDRADKGDLGNLIIPGFEPRPLSHPGLPFVIKEKE